MSSPKIHIILANGANTKKRSKDVLRLDYRKDEKCDKHINISLPKFVLKLQHIPSRLLDLLELASYVYAADRCITRGRNDAVEYHSWSRNIKLIMRVRDYKFWKNIKVISSLQDALNFMTGDEWILEFKPGHKTPAVGLFDNENFKIEREKAGSTIALFSGGLDSLAGVLDHLKNSTKKIVLASHQSCNATKATQKVLVEALASSYPHRIIHYPFECNLKEQRAIDETQRSRSFLFTSIAYALSYMCKENCIYVFENGVTSINIPRREDQLNSRASRTTHPQTISRLERFFSLLNEKQFRIYHPFLNKTKTEILNIIKSIKPQLISNAVSCTRAPFSRGDTTHCGKCLQCIDRRMGAFASGTQEYDHQGLYQFNIFSESLDPEAKTVAIDYIRQALYFSKVSIDQLYDDYLCEFSQVEQYLPGKSELEKRETLWKLFKDHGCNVRKALSTMRVEYDDIFSKQPQIGTLFELINQREYLRPDQVRLADKIISILLTIGEMFRNTRPKDERDLNDKIGALLRSHDAKFRSEYPTTSFACARVIPDHLLKENDVLIEAKYIRTNTTPSTANEAIAADITKYPKEAFIVFVIYDPDHKIQSDMVFKEEIESRGRNRVVIIR